MKRTSPVLSLEVMWQTNNRDLIFVLLPPNCPRAKTITHSMQQRLFETSARLFTLLSWCFESFTTEREELIN